ncbi:MAG TPA: type I-U CRISPR-associated protein Csx17 [Candidatus Binatia bacterium]|nr:type I-U CRISPR-associated protein Csx17 [Candidatus Binatia bacterium]
MTKGIMHEVVLTGCRPEPLGSYLKALGIIRTVAEQCDPEVRAMWRGEHLVVRGRLDRDALVMFFLERWVPTPVIAPWNGGSGFYPKDNRKAPDAILASSDPRLACFARAISIARALLADADQRPTDEAKVDLVAQMRGVLPDEAVAWIDAAILIGEGKLQYPPLLGTGGNDGRLDFSNNFQQRVVHVLVEKDRAVLEASLFDTPVAVPFDGAMGQYKPAAGGRSNPWDFVLLIEGALLFAGAATRRYENSPLAMAFPFHARAAGGTPLVADSDEAESRDELWLPLWSAAASYRELRRLFSEGRATVGQGNAARDAVTSLDFARAISAFGVARGIKRFVRIGFHVRNGLAYYATPLGRYETRDIPASRLLDEIDGWYGAFRRASLKSNAPANVRQARRVLEQAMFTSTSTGAIAPVLLALSDAESALATSLSFTLSSYLRPVPRLSSAWLDALPNTIERRVAAGLAARPLMRRRMLPLDESGRGFGRPDDFVFTFRHPALIDNLLATLSREAIETAQGLLAEPVEFLRPRCTLSDIARFITGDVDDRAVARWLRALVLVTGGDEGPLSQDASLPPLLFALMALVHNRRVGDEIIHTTPGALRRCSAGDATGASALAIRRLNAVGGRIPFPAVTASARIARRTAAALTIPLSVQQRMALERQVLPAFETTAVRHGDAHQETT